MRRRLKSLAGGRPRLSVFRSAKNIYAQVIDDVRGVTLAAASSLETGVTDKGSDKDAAAKVGALVAQRALEKGAQGRRVRSRRLYLSRADQGARGSGS